MEFITVVSLIVVIAFINAGIKAAPPITNRSIKPTPVYDINTFNADQHIAEAMDMINRGEY